MWTWFWATGLAAVIAVVLAILARSVAGAKPLDIRPGRRAPSAWRG